MCARRGRRAALACVLALASGLAGCGERQNPFAPVGNVFFTFTDLRRGTGPVSAVGDVLTINYTGWLHDSGETDNKGQRIDSASDQTFVLGAGQVIAGFDQGLVGMSVGGLRRLNIPPHLAFGSTGSDNVPRIHRSAPFQIIDLKIGTGPEAVNGDTLTVRYAGWLYDEDQVDNKGLRFEVGPATGFTFVLGTGQVIPGWDQGLVGMREEGERRLIVPPELAYGSTRRSLIPPNATLVFDVQLVTLQ
ncbi:Peptidyl-prolyl cis-trans isomerase FKBP10 [Geodia barretti]|uniref:peptidylprolyl isomerase n=1 Tax=Geodia barretti TaxID=519541 RepID=A0AA35QZC4_GEOBA|nr:Peptidyl-prolyl cis-trans isomerase FKBP10 [Geodia barretti]